MSPHPLLGVVFHWLGGLASGSFYVPYKGVRKWSWETYWLAGGIFSWLVAPLAAGFMLSSDLISVLQETPNRILWLTYLMGVLWGFGGLTFGLTMRYLGMSLGMAVALGYCAAFGTLIPPIAKGEFESHLLGNAGGRLVLVGVLVCILGIFLGGLAGVRKDKENGGGRSAIREFNLTKGLLIGTFSGIMSACFAFGFQFGEPITKISAAHGSGPLWVGLPVLVVILAGGFTTNCFWCVLLHVRNGSGSEYFVRQGKSELIRNEVTSRSDESRVTDTHIPVAHVPLLRNWVFCALAGVTWYLQFFFYQMGESQMGDFRFSSWTLHMASIIIFSTLWGIYFREWKGAGKKTQFLVACMLMTLVASTVIIGWGNYMSIKPTPQLAKKVSVRTQEQKLTFSFRGSKRNIQ